MAKNWLCSSMQPTLRELLQGSKDLRSSWNFPKFLWQKATVKSWHAISNLSSDTYVALKCLGKLQNDLRILLKLHFHDKHGILLIKEANFS